MRRNQLNQRPSLVCLSDRITPAVVLTALDLDGDGATDDVRIIGDSRANKLEIIDNGVNEVQIKVDANGDGDVADTAIGDQIVIVAITGKSFATDIQLRGGNDSVLYVPPTLSDVVRHFKIDLGAGNDYLGVETQGINQTSVFSMNLIGGSGNDKFEAFLGVVGNSALQFRADLGTGNDTGDFRSSGIDNGSTADVVCELGNGLNSLNLELSAVGKFARANANVSVLGGTGADNITMALNDDVGDGTVPSHLGIAIDLLGGNDQFLGKLDGGNFLVDNLSQAEVMVRGGLGNDVLKWERTGTQSWRLDAQSLFIINMEGGLGNDTVSVDFGGVDGFRIDNQAIFKVRLDGGAGNDVLSTNLSNDLSTVGTYDVLLQGGAGNDTLVCNVLNNGGTPGFGPAGGLLVDGGLGIDMLSSINNNLLIKVDVETNL